MKSVSLITHPDQTYEGLTGLGDRLDLPAGWAFRAVELDADLVLTPDNGSVRVTQDDLGNVYDRAGGPSATTGPEHGLDRTSVLARTCADDRADDDPSNGRLPLHEAEAMRRSLSMSDTLPRSDLERVLDTCVALLAERARIVRILDDLGGSWGDTRRALNDLSNVLRR